ncbi:hypothetical protein GCM10027452_20200 [Micromonospora halotolerans]
MVSCTAPPTPVVTTESRTCCGVQVGCASSSSAAAPATCGEAIEVPFMATEPSVVPIFAETMPVPGAKVSRQRP